MNPNDPNLIRVELVIYLAERFHDVLHHRDFDNTLPGLVVYDDLYDSRIKAVHRRISTIANLHQK